MSTYPELLQQGRDEERELIRVRREGARAIVTLSDPPRLNSLTPGLVLPLQAHLAELAADPQLRAIIVTGEDPAFSAGGDLEMIESGSTRIRTFDDPSDTTDAWRWIRRHFGGVVRTIASTDKAFIAAINGAAAGVGLAFALACDVLVASDRAVLVPAFGRLGLVPEVGTSWLMTRRLGYHGALALYVEGRHLGADEALRLGLVQEVCAHEDLLAGAGRWCERIERLPPHAFEMTKPLLRAAADAGFEQSLTMEEFAEGNCFSTTAPATVAAAIRARVA